MSKPKWTEEDVPDQTGRTAIVTGANTGIGFETARALAEKGATVILACRDTSKGTEAAERIRARKPYAKIEAMELDLADFASVRTFVERFNGRHDRLDLLINNAGVMIPPYSKTKEGFELQFGTNHLGHFALTGLLLDRIVGTPDSRIVNVSSMAHKRGKLDFDDLQWEKRTYSATQAYCDSKIANLYFTFELQRRLSRSGSAVVVTASHPGWTSTDLQRHSNLLRILNRPFAQKPQAGAWPTLLAAVDPSARGGEYYGPDGFMEIKGHPTRVQPNTLSQDRDIAARLWEVSEYLTGVRF